MVHGIISRLQSTLVDAEMVKDSCRFKMDLEPALQRTVHGQVKPCRQPQALRMTRKTLVSP